MRVKKQINCILLWSYTSDIVQIAIGTGLPRLLC
jgi:hypothetical protein